MNDPGLDQDIAKTAQSVDHDLGHRRKDRERQKVTQPDRELRRWWFTETAFPLIAATFAPIASLTSILSDTQNWRIAIPEGKDVTQGVELPDPAWVRGLSYTSLGLGIIANLLLLLNFARRVRYAVAQPLTIGLWYTSSLLLLFPLALIDRNTTFKNGTRIFTQAFYHGIIAAVLYTLLGSLLLWHFLGSHLFHAYPPSFSSLTLVQRTLMLQSIFYTTYLIVGGKIFASIEGWILADGVFWAQYTLLTVGFGSDLPLHKLASRILVIPYAVGGIMAIGLVIGGVRSLLIDKGKKKMVRRAAEMARERWADQGGEDKWSRKRKEFEAMRKIERTTELARESISIGVATFTFLLLWMGGAMVFYFTERASQNWSYFDSLYFSFIALTTIGYGDLYLESNAGRPFFLIWSFIAIPSVTFFVSATGGVVVKGVRLFVEFLAERDMLPIAKRETELENGDVEDSRQRPINRDSNKQKQEAEDGRTKEGIDGAGIVEEVGEAVKRAEESRGRGGSDQARLARAIRELALDVGKVPQKSYSWDEWKYWLELLDEPSMHDEEDKEIKRRDHGALENHRNDPGTRSGGEDSEGDEVKWTWLADDGPLFGKSSESEWLLGRMCLRLEELLGKEEKR